MIGYIRENARLVAYNLLSILTLCFMTDYLISHKPAIALASLFVNAFFTGGSMALIGELLPEDFDPAEIWLIRIVEWLPLITGYICFGYILFHFGV